MLHAVVGGLEKSIQSLQHRDIYVEFLRFLDRSAQENFNLLLSTGLAIRLHTASDAWQRENHLNKFINQDISDINLAGLYNVNIFFRHLTCQRHALFRAFQPRLCGEHCKSRKRVPCHIPHDLLPSLDLHVRLNSEDNFAVFKEAGEGFETLLPYLRAQWRIRKETYLSILGSHVMDYPS